MKKIYKLSLLIYIIFAPFSASAINWHAKYALQHNELLRVKQDIKINNYPNPVTSQTTISYVLPAKAKVILKVVDITGKQLAILTQQEQDAGKQEFDWQLHRNHIKAGMYILILQVDNINYTKKIIVQ